MKDLFLVFLSKGLNIYRTTFKKDTHLRTD